MKNKNTLTCIFLAVLILLQPNLQIFACQCHPDCSAQLTALQTARDLYDAAQKNLDIKAEEHKKALQEANQAQQNFNDKSKKWYDASKTYDKDKRTLDIIKFELDAALAAEAFWCPLGLVPACLAACAAVVSRGMAYNAALETLNDDANALSIAKIALDEAANELQQKRQLSDQAFQNYLTALTEMHTAFNNWSQAQNAYYNCENCR